MNLIGLPAEGGKCGSLLPDGVGARGLYTRIWDSRQIVGFTMQSMMLYTCELGLIVVDLQMFNKVISAAHSLPAHCAGHKVVQIVGDFFVPSVEDRWT